MKKIYLISSIAIFLGMVFALNPGWFRFLWGQQILLLPLVIGIFMVLVQDENRSYRFMPKLIAGSFLTSFIFVFLWWTLHYDQSGNLYISEALYTALFFSGLCIFGGLIGVVVRGATLLIKGHAKNK